MKSSKVRNYGIIMIVSVLINFAFYYAAHVYHLPMWMDSIGTAYAAVVLEPAAGLLVGFATNFFQSAAIYGAHSLLYYFVSAIAALTFGIILRKEGKICFKKMPKAVLSFIVFGTIAAGLLTMWSTNGVPDSGWERYFYDGAMGIGIPQFLSCMWGTFVLKVADGLIIGVLVPVFCRMTPKKMVTETMKENLSWKEPFWKPFFKIEKK